MGKHSKVNPNAKAIRAVRITFVGGLLAVSWLATQRPPEQGEIPATTISATTDPDPAVSAIVGDLVVPEASTKEAIQEVPKETSRPRVVPTTPVPTKQSVAPTTVTPVPKTVPPTTTVTPTTTLAAPLPTAAGDHSNLISIARTYIGKGIPYVYGGKNPATGLDCSGYVWVVLKQAGYKVPYRTSDGLQAWTTPITAKQARPGDLVFWPGHVGFYAGPGIVIDNGTSAGPKQTTIWGTPSYGRIPL